ncbi:putative F-box protein At3g16210 [Rutidosis leptorrhynchoides]|uniref:putative F-box protein At3g16210 n=1 Tax=Rutidosis leptorrhynchoides TaxID=125765 RepID=UPI003A99FC53
MDHLVEMHYQILKRLNVSDLIRCKSVCKSWLSIIYDPQFIKSHLTQSYLNDRDNDGLGDRRLAISLFPGYLKANPFEIGFNESRILGSCDGLVCVLAYCNKLRVLNPSTREVKRVANPIICIGDGAMYWGVGYDPYTDDYKIIQGFKSGENYYWREVNYTFISSNGVLYNGLLHWVGYNSTEKFVTLSFNLSEEKFVEVPQPNDEEYQFRVGQHESMRLRNMEECLCVFRQELVPREIWVMKDYNNRCWEIFLEYEREKKSDDVHCVKLLTNYVSSRWSLCHDMLWCDNRKLLGTPTFVESLVSPHLLVILA